VTGITDSADCPSVKRPR